MELMKKQTNKQTIIQPATTSGIFCILPQAASTSTSSSSDGLLITASVLFFLACEHKIWLSWTSAKRFTWHLDSPAVFLLCPETEESMWLEKSGWGEAEGADTCRQTSCKINTRLQAQFNLTNEKQLKPRSHELVSSDRDILLGYFTDATFAFEAIKRLLLCFNYRVEK